MIERQKMYAFKESARIRYFFVFSSFSLKKTMYTCTSYTVRNDVIKRLNVQRGNYNFILARLRAVINIKILGHYKLLHRTFAQINSSIARYHK